MDREEVIETLKELLGFAEIVGCNGEEVSMSINENELEAIKTAIEMLKEAR